MRALILIVVLALSACDRVVDRDVEVVPLENEVIVNSDTGEACTDDEELCA